MSFWLSCHVIFDVGLPLCTIWRWPATGSYKSRNITSILSMSTILAVARILGVGISPDAWHSPSNSAQDWCCSVERRSSIPKPNAPDADAPRAPPSGPQLRHHPCSQSINLIVVFTNPTYSSAQGTLHKLPKASFTFKSTRPHNSSYNGASAR